jgi:hypothetical protein
MSEVGDSKGDKVVLLFKNNPRLQKTMIIPKPMKIMPKYVYGTKRTA